MLVKQRIQNFLNEHPTGTLQVAVAYASVWGLAWLDYYTPGRRTNLLIGNIPKEDYGCQTNDQRERALAFLNRTDVTISNYESFDSGKTRVAAWLVMNEDSPLDWGSHHLLVGSAKLNEHSLKREDELMAEAAESDVRDSVGRLKGLYGASWSCRKMLLEYIQVDDSGLSNWG